MREFEFNNPMFITQPEGTSRPHKEGYTEETLFKVFKTLRETGMDENTATEAINALQNAGILFRERIIPPKIFRGLPE